jgi:hypothetical protein
LLDENSMLADALRSSAYRRNLPYYPGGTPVPPRE